MKSTCIITLSKTDPFLKELGIDNLFFCEEIPARRKKPSKKEQKKRNNKKGTSLYIEGLEAYYFQNYKKAEELLQEALSLFTRGTTRYNKAEYYLKKARHMGGIAA